MKESMLKHPIVIGLLVLLAIYAVVILVRKLTLDKTNPRIQSVEELKSWKFLVEPYRYRYNRRYQEDEMVDFINENVEKIVKEYGLLANNKSFLITFFTDFLIKLPKDIIEGKVTGDNRIDDGYFDTYSLNSSYSSKRWKSNELFVKYVVKCVADYLSETKSRNLYLLKNSLPRNKYDLIFENYIKKGFGSTFWKNFMELVKEAFENIKKEGIFDMTTYQNESIPATLIQELKDMKLKDKRIKKSLDVGPLYSDRWSVTCPRGDELKPINKNYYSIIYVDDQKNNDNCSNTLYAPCWEASAWDKIGLGPTSSWNRKNPTKCASQCAGRICKFTPTDLEFNMELYKLAVKKTIEESMS